MSLDNVIFLTGGRLSFPHLAVPQPKKPNDPVDKPPSYSAAILMTPDNPGWARFHQVVQQMAMEKWKEKAPAAIQMINADTKKRCYAAGQEKVNATTFKIIDGYEGMVVITAGNKMMPQMIDANGQGVGPANTGACQALARAMYAGCYVNVAIKPWLQENTHGIGVRCELISVQFHSDGKPFGETVRDASAMFGATAPVAGAVPWGAPAAAPNPFGAPVAPAMPAAPFPGQQAAPVAMPPGFAPPVAAPNPFGAPAAPPWMT